MKGLVESGGPAEGPTSEPETEGGRLRRQPREHRQRKGSVARRTGEAMFLTRWDGGARLTGKS